MSASLHGEVAYEPRDFMHDGSYPAMGDHQVPSPGADTFVDPNDAVVNELTNGVAYDGTTDNFEDDAEHQLDLDSPAAEQASVHTPAPTNGRPLTRVKPLDKPVREVIKNAEGKFICTWPECTEEVREFARRCEWTKHMDKHDRPYKCLENGCEKLPGFTYSGGLLRHEREVHGKHGGPRHTFLCPHATCKRHTGKGFSRQENLNEHLRRVHTPSAGEADRQSEAARTNEDGSSASPPARAAGKKRARVDAEPEESLLEEVKRLRQENAELRIRTNRQGIQITALLHRLHQDNGLKYGGGQDLDNGATLGGGPML